MFSSFTNDDFIRNITLICTYHAAEGRCNEKELYSILERMQPDVIFEEIPPSYYDAYYVDESREHNLETAVISKYAKVYGIPHIPVDSDDVPPESFFSDHHKLMKRVRGGIDRNAYNYRTLSQDALLNIKQGGFKYLNSQNYLDLNDELTASLETALKVMGDDKFFEIHRSWNEVHAKREDEMIRNIYRYSSEHTYNKAVFLIGATHRKSIIQKVEAHRGENVKLNWKH